MSYGGSGKGKDGSESLWGRVTDPNKEFRKEAGFSKSEMEKFRKSLDAFSKTMMERAKHDAKSQQKAERMSKRLTKARNVDSQIDALWDLLGDMETKSKNAGIVVRTTEGKIAKGTKLSAKQRETYEANKKILEAAEKEQADVRALLEVLKKSQKKEEEKDRRKNLGLKGRLLEDSLKVVVGLGKGSSSFLTNFAKGFWNSSGGSKLTDILKNGISNGLKKSYKFLRDVFDNSLVGQGIKKISKGIGAMKDKFVAWTKRSEFLQKMRDKFRMGGGGAGGIGNILGAGLGALVKGVGSLAGGAASLLGKVLLGPVGAAIAAGLAGYELGKLLGLDKFGEKFGNWLFKFTHPGAPDVNDTRTNAQQVEDAKKTAAEASKYSGKQEDFRKFLPGSNPLASDYSHIGGTKDIAKTEVINDITSAAKAGGVDPATMLAFARQESAFGEKTDSGTSSAKGLFQFTKGTWAEQSKKFGFSAEDVNDPAKNAQVAASFMKDNKTYLEAHGVKAGPNELYAAHFLGPAGAVQFLTAMNNNPGAIGANLFPSAAKSNPNIFYDKKTGTARTLADIYGIFNSKIGAIAQSYGTGEATPVGMNATAIASSGGGSGGTTLATPSTIQTQAPTATVAAGGSTAQATPVANSTPNIDEIPMVVSDSGLIMTNAVGAFAS